MSPEGGRAPSLLCLIVIAAGLNIYTSSMSIPATSNMASFVKTELTNQTPILNSSSAVDTIKAATSPVTLSLTTTLRSIEKVIPLSTPNDISSTSEMTISTTNLLSQSSTGLQSTEHMPASVMSVYSSATTNISPAETVAATTSGIMRVSSISSSSFAPEEYTSSSVIQLSSIEVSTVPMTSKKHPVEGITSGVTTKPLTSSNSVGTFTYSQGTLASKAVETSPIGRTTFSSEVTMQEVQRALSSGSIAAITITVIAVVLLVFGIAAFLKIRHSSYGRLFDDHDYGSWGNYNNPLYDDS
ncbi:prostate androgen-regulated mucin-like protein 1 [Protobothrops mucrosquamatus]|uniref:prostate androgen-regulated mucin-like protein 1 n=1 Tax=Protobothrops mucrosquamatus TaxID=103944 RepID=UPI000775FDF8|nr:prostate androgen-regulated mucin-like protein 1 [Protobothrops mucrosquamatus]